MGRNAGKPVESDNAARTRAGRAENKQAETTKTGRPATNADVEQFHATRDAARSAQEEDDD